MATDEKNISACNLFRGDLLISKESESTDDIYYIRIAKIPVQPLIANY